MTSKPKTKSLFDPEVADPNEVVSRLNQSSINNKWSFNKKTRLFDECNSDGELIRSLDSFGAVREIDWRDNRTCLDSSGLFQNG